jgi:decaprenylphospho-beta-D-ribofuranose 2-oxidase
VRPRALANPVLCGWGRLCAPGTERRGEDLRALTQGAVLSRGLGRSYGDSSLPPPSVREVVGTPLADRILGFDVNAGLLRVEAGFSLAELTRLFLRRGWFTKVCPGTQYVTVGGMVAADVHGKNHHRDGTFGAHVRRLLLRVADGRLVECSREVEPELFFATVGGMGLTGHILEVEFALEKLPSPWIWCESERVPDIDAYVNALKRSSPLWPYTVGWIDCLSRGRNLGRGILLRGRWAEKDEAPKRPPPPKGRLKVPFDFPSWALGRLSARAFNALYYWKHLPKQRAGLAHPESFFFPLDVLREWNRVYGRRGFTQYQCVLPDEAGRGAARRFLEHLTAKGGASFLCVIKDCGPQGEGLLSFPRSGISIALDLPVRDGTPRLVSELNEVVVSLGGRIYLAKDAFTRPEHFLAMEPRLDDFLAVRRRWDPEGRIRSAQSVRLLGDRP